MIRALTSMVRTACVCLGKTRFNRATGSRGSLPYSACTLIGGVEPFRSDGQFLDQVALRDHTRVGLGRVETSGIVRMSDQAGKPALCTSMCFSRRLQGP